MLKYLILIFNLFDLNNSYLVSSMSDIGEPLILTDCITQEKIEEGQEACEVKPLIGNIKSYSGFFTVNDTDNSNMYFWYFPSETLPKCAPVILWLQGGPGASSMYGLFEENGPYYINKCGKLKLRDVYWSQNHHIIYLDNPIGTGFSFTDTDDGYSTNIFEIGQNLYSAICQFFQLFPDLKNNDFYLAGQSYAGKYIPAVGYIIHKANPRSNFQINLKGLIIGCGFCDPVHMIDYSDIYYNFGLIDGSDIAKMKLASKSIVNLIKKKKWLAAFEEFDAMIGADLTPYKTLAYNITNFSYYYNLMNNTNDLPYGDANEFLESPEIRKSIHIGTAKFHTYKKVQSKIKKDMMKSVAPLVEVLLNNYRILFYSGQLDLIVPYRSTVNFLNHLHWCGSHDYKIAKRSKWIFDGEIAGYFKHVRSDFYDGTLTEVLIRNAGHITPHDQPIWMKDLITKFTRNQELHTIT